MSHGAVANPEAPDFIPAETPDFIPHEEKPAAKPGIWSSIKNAFTGPMGPGASIPELKKSYQDKGGKVEMPGSFEGHPENVGEYVPATAGRAAEGAVDMSRGNYAMGLHKEVQAVGNAVAPMAPFFVAAAPVAAGRAAVGGYLGSKAGTGIAHAAGATDDQAALAGDVGGAVGGYAGVKLPAAGRPVTSLIKNTAGKIDPDVLGIVSPRAAHVVRLANRVGNAVSKVSAPGVDIPGGVPPTGPYPAPQSAPYSVSGANLTEPATVTPRQVLPPSRRLNAVNPDPYTPAPAEPAPAPYRMGRGDVPQAQTVTPRQAIGPERQLGTGEIAPEPPQALTPAPLKAQTPAAAQAEILKRMGVAAPRATLKPMEIVPGAELKPSPEQSFHGIKTGDSAIRSQLAKDSGRSGINNLRAIAQQRGIKVSPGDTNQTLHGKILETVTPAEREAFEQTAVERMQPDYSVRSTNGEVAPKPPNMRVGNNTEAGAAADTAVFAEARKNLGPGATTSQITQEALRLQKMESGGDLIEGLQQMKAKKGR